MCRWRKKTDGENRLGNGFRMCAGRCCALSASRRRSALSRHSVGSLLYVSELWAGEMLRSAGCSSGRSFCARGGRSARRCGSLAAFCVRITPAVRLSRGVLCSDHARCAALSWCFAFVARPLCGSLAAFCVRVTPAVCRMSAKQDGLRYVSFLFRRGSGSPVVRSRASIRLFGLAGSLRAWAFSYGDPDEGTESAARRE